MKVANPTARMGEELACSHLRKLGYKIIDRNFRKGYGEVDVVALEDDTLVFVEVKTRKSNAYGTPFEGITPWKLHTLTRSAQFYALSHPHLPKALRIDAVSVMLTPQNKVLEIELIKNISLA